MQPPDDEIDVRDHVVDATLLDADDLEGGVGLEPGVPDTDREVVEAFDGDDIEIIFDDGDDSEASEESEDSGIDAPPGATRRPPVDPRIRARRIAVAREQGRRRLRVVLVLLSVIVVVGSAWLAVHSPFVDVDHIVVTGVPDARIAAIVAASGVHRHDPLLLVSAGKVAHRVERVPGIGTVHVSLDFPGTVRIAVRQLGVALWARIPAGGVALIGHDGRVLRYALSPPPGGIELLGEKVVPAPGGQIVRAAVVGVMAQLPAPLAARVGALSARAPSDVRLYLRAGGEVRFGDLSSVHDKAVSAEAVIEHMACQLVYVDVRSLSNPVALPARNTVCNPS